MIKFCACKPHEFQDKRYGTNMRVHTTCNYAGGKKGNGKRCTVCAKESLK